MMTSQFYSGDFLNMYTSVFEQKDAVAEHNDANAIVDLLFAPPGSPFDESLPGSPESAYSCFSDASPFLPVDHTIENNIINSGSEDISGLFDVMLNYELFPQSVYGSDGELDTTALFNNHDSPSDCGQQLAHHIHRHHASISQMMATTTEPYPVCTSPEHLTVDHSLKAPKIRVSRRSPSGTNEQLSSNMMIDNDDGSIMVLTETGAATFKCKLCPNASFGRIHDYQRHQTSKHQAVTFPCEFCTKLFARRDALLRHYNVKSSRHDGIHPREDEAEKLAAARARAKLLR